jgi:hypothetical protein
MAMGKGRVERGPGKCIGGKNQFVEEALNEHRQRAGTMRR